MINRPAPRLIAAALAMAGAVILIGAYLLITGATRPSEPASSTTPAPTTVAEGPSAPVAPATTPSEADPTPTASTTPSEPAAGGGEGGGAVDATDEPPNPLGTDLSKEVSADLTPIASSYLDGLYNFRGSSLKTYDRGVTPLVVADWYNSPGARDYRKARKTLESGGKLSGPPILLEDLTVEDLDFSSSVVPAKATVTSRGASATVEFEFLSVGDNYYIQSAESVDRLRRSSASEAS